MKQILGNKNIAGTLDKIEEKGEFYKVLQEQAGKGKNIGRTEIRKTLGYFRSGEGKSIDKSEAQKIAGEFSGVLGSKKYIFSKENKENSTQDRRALGQKMENSEKNNPVVSPRGDISPITKRGSSSGRSTTAPHLKF
jgi:hypothetical protein